MIAYADILSKTVQEIPNCEALEFGVFIGESTEAFLKGIEKCNGHLTSVDNIFYPKTAEKLGKNDKWEYIITDSKTFKSKKKFDVILVDTIHEYSHIKAECEVIKKLIKSGTIIFFHDIYFAREIKQAIDEFVKEVDCIGVDISRESKYGMFQVIIK